MMTRAYLGIDPGATTGLVLLREPADHDPRRRVLHWRVVHRGTRRGTDAQRDLWHAQQISDALIEMCVEAHVPPAELAGIVLEEPWDVSDTATWRPSSRGGRPARRGTAFRVGAAYGRALAALDYVILQQQDPQRPIPIVSYRVSGPQGWMGRRRATAVYAVLVRLAQTAHRAPSEPAAIDMPADALAAFGVALHHAGTP